MIASSNNYKNSLKKLRKINSSLINKREKHAEGNYYKYLIEEQIEEQEQVEDHALVKKTRASYNCNDLPEDIINIILAFLPYKTRLLLLKRKYSRSSLKCMLQNIPDTNEDLTKMWKCASIASNLLQSVINDDSRIFENIFTYSVRFFEKENAKLYSLYYKEHFTKIILAALRHYSAIYKFGSYTNKSVIEHVEQIMLNIFAHLVKLSKNA
jgi:hypothetical protein